VFNPLIGVYLVVFFVGFVVCAYRLRDDIGSVQPGEEQQPCARSGLVIFGAGLVLVAARLLQIDPFFLNAPAWMIAAILVLMLGSWRCYVESRAG
jgi:hypothetical protein